MIDVTGRTAFIAGGTNGIGLGIARALAAAGAKLALVDVDPAALERIKAELDATASVIVAELDVRDRESYRRVADEVETGLGPVSLLFNNAGVASGGVTAQRTYQLWDSVIGVDLLGVVNGVQTFLPRMLARGGGGHIVNTASGAGLVGGGFDVVYCTSQFGVVGLSEALRNELGEAGVGVSVLCPGPKGVNAAVIGEIVLNAVRLNHLYIHTDRSMAEAIAMRGKAILDAVPVG